MLTRQLWSDVCLICLSRLPSHLWHVGFKTVNAMPLDALIKARHQDFV